eukprot:GFYU01014756.1.p1 GENE.GFYU01014756.1~~GFYU01014756.1.p1  ORF type:complete len:279 (-),score=50.25 GFYU01014756.1:69-905(-)
MSMKDIEDLVLPTPPEKPLPGDCCNSGCFPCVYDTYYDEMERYNETCEKIRQAASVKKEAAAAVTPETEGTAVKSVESGIVIVQPEGANSVVSDETKDIGAVGGTTIEANVNVDADTDRVDALMETAAVVKQILPDTEAGRSKKPRLEGDECKGGVEKETCVSGEPLPLHMLRTPPELLTTTPYITAAHSVDTLVENTTPVTLDSTTARDTGRPANSTLPLAVSERHSPALDSTVGAAGGGKSCGDRETGASGGVGVGEVETGDTASNIQMYIGDSYL